MINFSLIEFLLLAKLVINNIKQVIFGHKVKLNPTETQVRYFRQAAGCARLAFNWGVARWKQIYSENKRSISAWKLKKEFNAIKKRQFPFVYEVTKCACEGGFQDLQNAINNFFSDIKKQKVKKNQKIRFLQYKKKHKSKPQF